MVSMDRVRFILNRFRERLWVKPLAVCLLSTAAAFFAKLADDTFLAQIVPVITAESIDAMLSIMATSMLVIATLSVTSMVSAYASASSIATPRSFSLVVADGASQNALSTFVGAFIFSIVALTAAKNDYFEQAGLFILFVLTVIVFAIVIITFVRWVDSIARLGRMGSTIDKVEQAAAKALTRRRDAPNLCALPSHSPPSGRAVFATDVGYVQYIDIAALQIWAEEAHVRVAVVALPGTLVDPNRALAFVSTSLGDAAEIDCQRAVESFKIGGDRLFDDDPRFGLIVLSEIASRALSPAVNDPGTAIDVIGALQRLFTLWSDHSSNGDEYTLQYDRVEVPALSVRDMFDDAFTAIARDGASMVEVAVRLQKSLHALAVIDGDTELRNAAEYHSQLALKRARMGLDLAEDFAVVRDAARFVAPVVSAKT
jgi:uncharacterized membrane protein